MAKTIYILETKLSSEKVQQLTEMLQVTQEYKMTRNYTLADYIVTELKSPSRIMRMVKKSTCPIVHISWLLESIQQESLLNPLNYLIDVSEARKQVRIDLSTRISVRTLPRQYTWDQIAKKRLNQAGLEVNPKVLRTAGLQARSLFKRSHSNKTNSTQKRPVNKVTTLDNLEQEIQSAATLPSSDHPDKNHSNGIVKKEEASTVTFPSSNGTRPLGNRSFSNIVKKEEVTANFPSSHNIYSPVKGRDVVVKKENAVPTIPATADSLSDILSRLKSSIRYGTTYKPNQAETSDKSKLIDVKLTPTPISNEIKRTGSSNVQQQETNKAVSLNKQDIHESSFSVVDTTEVNSLPASNCLSFSITEVHEHPTEKKQSFESYSVPESLNFSFSSISSIEEFEPKKYSLSSILSL
ncbi:hypothetical protein BD770DRAFT_77272 [Pilaira anomala]|nr:hypothetical protein BD770DRAFT_77272 [Pilaira anomala]